jgi:aryl-alcohol dehydrogenase-like predicted oxidoreductase
MSTAIDTGQVATSTSDVVRAIGPSDLQVYPIALSGNVFGWTADVEATAGILDRFVDDGGNFIDTADSYAAGRSEIMIGNWMRDRKNRSDVVVATKIGKSADNPGLSPRAVARSVDASLERLKTGHIDLLYLHIDDPQIPFEETLLAVDSLIAAGKVRYFGGSDHTGNRIIEARIASAQLGVAHMIALQNQYSLMHRAEYESGLAHVATAQRLGVMPRFALASGFLSGKYRSRADLGKSVRGTEAARYLNRKGLKVIEALDAVAKEHDESIASIALAWLLSKPNVVAPVVSASHPEQVAELTAAPRVRLSRQELAELDRVSAWK